MKSFEFNQDNYFKILNKAIELDIEEGHLNWTLTKLSKESQFSRSMIYYYFSSNKSEILTEAIVKLGEKIMGQDQERWKLIEEGRLKESFFLAKEYITQIKPFPQLYFLHRGKETELGNKIQKLEELFEKKLMYFFPQLEDGRIRILQASLMGMLFSDRIKHQDIDQYYEAAIQQLTQ